MQMELNFKTLQQDEYLSKFLGHGIRPDGRKISDSRPVIVNTGSVSTADGSALVRMGGTLVTCGVKAELSNPPVESGDCGYLVCNVELPPLCSPHITPGPPSTHAQSLTQSLQDTLISCQCIDLKSLCLVEEKLCWALYVDVVCLCDNGNVYDATYLAATAALKNTSLPTVDTSSGSPEVSCKDRVPLSLHHLPVAVSYGLFQSHILLDPTHDEESVCSGHVSVIVLPHMNAGQPDCKLLGGVMKSGHPSLPSEQLIELTQLAQKKAEVLLELLYTALEMRRAVDP